MPQLPVNDDVLNYATLSKRSRIPWPWLVSAAGVIGVAYWSVADFWAYVGEGATATPKFEMPLWWQFLESSVVGVASTALLFLVFLGGRRLWRHITSRWSGPAAGGTL